MVNGGLSYYTYDAQNQLLEARSGGKTYTYTYDSAGNIQTASDGTTTHNYTYDTGVWKDLLKYFDGEEIVYDASGNPTTYYNGTEWKMTWAEGRRLDTASKSGTSLSFTYDSDGLRLSKTVNNSTTYNYYYAGGKLMRQTDGTNTLDFFYDASGNPYALKYNGTLYYYITNLQGDVLHIVDTSGTPVVSYTYDPYGKLLTGTDSTLGNLNPLRYRGYVYDTETGLYYLQSRYYDPEIGRFINADAFVSTGQDIIGCNVFVYCSNNPVLLSDPFGQRAAPIGAGVQIELSIGGATVGIEVIVYWDVEECQNGAPVIAVYMYGGISIDVTDPNVVAILGMITDNASLLVGEDESGTLTMALASCIGDTFNVSVSAVLIFGNDDFKSTKDYEESFTSVGASFGKAKGSIAYSDTCMTISLGVNLMGTSNLLPSWGVSKTFYRQIFAYSVPYEGE